MKKNIPLLMKDVTVNRDDIAFVACRACVSVFENRGGQKRKGRKTTAGSAVISLHAHYLRSSQ